MEGSQYTFKLVQLCTPEPNKLVVMYDKRQRRLLCLRQVYTLFVDGLCNYQAFYRACCKQSNGNLTLLCGGDKQMLVKLGGLKACVPNVALVSLAACCKTLKICKVHATVLSAVEQLRLNPGSVTVLALPDHVLASCVVSSPDQCELQMTTPFPVTLPLCQLPADYKQKHGLHAKNQHLVLKDPFCQQLVQYKAWCTNPIQLDRNSCAHSSRTWQNTETQIFLFAGHCYHYHQNAEPSLQLFLSTNLIAQFVSFHIAAKHSHLTIGNFISCAKHVLRWWQTKPGGKHPSFVEGLQWLQTLKQQVFLRCLACLGYAL